VVSPSSIILWAQGKLIQMYPLNYILYLYYSIKSVASAFTPALARAPPPAPARAPPFTPSFALDIIRVRAPIHASSHHHSCLRAVPPLIPFHVASSPPDSSQLVSSFPLDGLTPSPKP
jgi:hypothetical protein